MILYAASDLHLDEAGPVRLFDDGRQGRAFAGLCESLRAGDELVLLGDVFDFTAMSPPQQGLEGFFRALDVPYAVPARRELPELLAAVRASNPIALGALAALSQRAPVTVVAGNHDRHLGAPGAAEVLAGIGLKVRVERHVVRTLAGRTVVLLHGHEFDKSNSEEDGGGEAMTNSLHQAVVPFLRHHGARRNVRMDPSRVIALRPEENVISVLQRWLDPETFSKLFRALLHLLAENGFLPRAGSWLAGFISPNLVRRQVERADRLWEHSGLIALKTLRGEHQLPDDLPRPDALVLGHTHVLDWEVDDTEGDRLYVNLGTWTERAFDGMSPPDMTLPVLELDEAEGRMQARLRDLQDGRVLQEFNGLPPPAGH